MTANDPYQCHACGEIQDVFAIPVGWAWANKRNGERYYLCQTCHAHMEALRFDRFAKQFRKTIHKSMRKFVFPPKKKKAPMV